MPSDISFSELQKHDDPAPVTPGIGTRTEDVDEISLLDLLIVLAERKHIILWMTLTFALVAIVISLVLPKRYTASVSLLPPQQSSSMGAAIASQLGNLGTTATLAAGGLGLKNPNDMYVAMLKSRTVEDAMVQHFDLMKEYHKRYLSDARKALERRATVDGSGKDGLIRVSVESYDPKRAAELANGYIDEFRRLSEHLAITEASQRRLFFEKQLEQARDNVANAEEALKSTEQKTGVIQLDSQARALIESAALLRGQVAAKEVEIQSLRTFATNENFQLVRAQQELEGLRTQLGKLVGTEGSADTGLMMPKRGAPEAGLEYVRRMRDVKYNETIFDILARQFEIAKLDEAKQGAVVQVVDAAVPPDKKSSPKRGIIIVVATLAGLLFGAVTVFFQAWWAHMYFGAESSARIERLRQTLVMWPRPRSNSHP